jgi:nicotinamidase-related amidase
MSALLLVDVQNDFLPPSGVLAVTGGDSILAVVHRLLDEGQWNLVVASQVCQTVLPLHKQHEALSRAFR